MFRRILLSALCLVMADAIAAPTPALFQAASYSRVFSTYFGGSMFEQVRDITTDSAGNIYITGGTESTNYPTTAGVYQRTHGGWFDVFITKFGPNGNVIWSTLLGGPNYDRAYGIEVDAGGFVYVSGRSGPGFPTTPGVLQTTYNGYYTGNAYGDQNAFIAKLRPDGSGLVFSTYFGSAGMNRDFDIDSNGDIYVASTYEPGAGQTPFPSAWFNAGFRKSPIGQGDNVVAKVRGDGTQVLWATYVGGSGNESGKNSLRVDSTGIYLFTNTNSTDMPTPNGYQTTFRGVQDFYLGKIALNGSSLLFGTYFGGTQTDWCETHHLAIGQGNVYISGITHSPDLPTTAGAYQRTFGGINGVTNFHATGDAFVAKFSGSGQLLASTFLGGRYGDCAQGLAVDGQGAVYFSGGTVSDNFPVTPGATQSTFQGVEDFIAAKMSSDLTQLLYCTYLGSSGYDEGRTAWCDSNGTFYVAGETSGTNWPVFNAAQPNYGGGNGDNIIVKYGYSTATPGTLQLNTSALSVNENAGNATLSVTRTGGSSGAISVTYATSNGTAMAGSDYAAAFGTLNWAAGDSTAKTITVPITNDTLVESNETFTVTISAPTGGATLGAPTSAVVTILDDDTAPPATPGTLRLNTNALSVPENAGPAVLSVTRTGGSTGAVSIAYATSNGTASSGSDYASASGTLNWANGDTSSRNITIPITNDTAVEGNEAFTVTLTSPGGGATLGAPSSVTVTILDDDTAPPPPGGGGTPPAGGPRDNANGDHWFNDRCGGGSIAQPPSPTLMGWLGLMILGLACIRRR